MKSYVQKADCRVPKDHLTLPEILLIVGVVLFGEYRRSSKRTYILLATMLSLFVVSYSEAVQYS